MSKPWGTGLAAVVISIGLSGCLGRSTNLQETGKSPADAGIFGIRNTEIALTSSTGRHFGYYAGAMWPENHITALANRSSFVFVYGSDYEAKLVQARSLGLKVILSVQPFFYGEAARIRSDFQQQWETARQAIAPYRDTILAFYTLDEPYLNGAIAGLPVNQTLDNLELVAKTVKASFPGIPLAMTEAYSHVSAQMVLPPSYDWFGFDCYSGFDSCGENVAGLGIRSIPQMYGILKSKVQALNQADGKHRGLVLFPPSAYHAKSGVTEAQLIDIADRYIQLIRSEPMVVAVMPFLWHTFTEGNGQWIGLRDSGPALKNKYLEMANEVLSGTSTPNPTPTSCSTPAFSGGSLSTRTVAPLGGFTLSCDYGNANSRVYPMVSSGSCSFLRFAGTAAQFSCTAPDAIGDYAVGCQLGANPAANTCARNDSLGNLSVRAPSPTPCSTPTFSGGSLSSRLVAPSENFIVSCNYGSASNRIYPVVPSGNCAFQQFSGASAQFKCTAPSAVGDYGILCQLGADPASNTCARADSLGSLSVRAPTPTPTPTCTPPTFRSGGLSSNSVYTGDELDVSCDYGRITSSISPLGGPTCRFTSFVGTSAKFRCTAPSVPGSYPMSCMSAADTASRTCAQIDPIGALNVIARPTCNQAPWQGGSVSKTSVAKGESFVLSCNYGMQTSTVYPMVSGASCTFVSFVGNEAKFNCVAPSQAGTLEVGCAFGAIPSKNLCTRTDRVGSVQVR